MKADLPTRKYPAPRPKGDHEHDFVLWTTNGVPSMYACAGCKDTHSLDWQAPRMDVGVVTH